MNIYQVRDSGPNTFLNTRYFWIEESKVDGDWQQKDLDGRVLLVSNDWHFASFRGKTYRVCELCIESDDDQPFVKVWEKDPFKDFTPEYMPTMPVDDEPETDYII